MEKLSFWGSIASIASFFQGIFRFNSKRNLNIGKDNVGGTYISKVGRDAKIESEQNPSTSIGVDNVGGNKIDIVEGNLHLSKSDGDTTKSLNVGKGNVGGDYIGQVGRDLTIGCKNNEIYQQLNADSIQFNEIKVTSGSQSLTQFEDLEKLGQAFNLLSNKVLNYAPELNDMQARKKELLEEFITFDSIFNCLKHNIPTPICNAVENFVFYSRLLEGLVNKINSLAPNTKNPNSPNYNQTTTTYYEDFNRFLENNQKLRQSSKSIQTEIKKARGIDM